jgi:hypothetical protein
MITKYFIGPMSKNIVDSVIEFCNTTGNNIGLIPSRRQVEWNGGYVNNWTTQDFASYVGRKTPHILLQRDHGGPNQGQTPDDGIESLITDCKNLSYIHIDPWKQGTFMECMKTTLSLIKMCYAINSGIKFEIGTEQSIRYLSVDDLEVLVLYLKDNLSTNEFKAIRFLVIQSGTSLKGTTQTGEYNSKRLKQMVAVAKKYDLYSKEHNGDYIPLNIIKEKFELGLDAINIAPEFGLIETQTYLDEIKEDDILEKYFHICYNSRKWVKWVNTNFDPFKNKIELIQICGHYILSDPQFISEIKSHFPGIDDKIKANIKNKLNELHGY